MQGLGAGVMMVRGAEGVVVRTSITGKSRRIAVRRTAILISGDQSAKAAFRGDKDVKTLLDTAAPQVDALLAGTK